jgi:hypothetical protein
MCADASCRRRFDRIASNSSIDCNLVCLHQPPLLVRLRRHPHSIDTMSTKKKVSTHATPRQSIEGASPRRSISQSSYAPVAVPAPAPGTGGVMNPYGPSIGAVNSASLYWSNLCLLGFDAAGQAAKHKVDLAPNMFDKPNAKAMQVLMHFILLKIKQCPQAEQHNNAAEWKEITNVRPRERTR